MPGSREELSPGQQLYGVIEFCKSDKSLFAKIHSGKYDWLGVKPDGTYVLGSPPIARNRFTASGIVSRPGATADNRVDVHVPGVDQPSSRHCSSPDEARLEFETTVKRLATEGAGSGIYRVVLISGGVKGPEQFVVRRRANFI